MCSIDWGIVKEILVALIGAGIPSIVAWCIYRKWKHQKGSEVIADETRYIIKNLLEIIRLANLISNSRIPDESTGDFKRFKDLYEPTVKSLLYIYNCVEIDELSYKNNNFFECALKFMNFESNFKPKFYDKEFRNDIEKNVGFIGAHAIKLVNTLIPYSSFQKEFIFKHRE